ncbi:MAG TPA: DNA methyltransferase [bacterium]|nr:DNA methyltransferase [bacterium]
MKKPEEHLRRIIKNAERLGSKRAVKNPDLIRMIDEICNCLSNRAGARLLMACMLAKIDNPNIDPRKPYTEIGDGDCFSGRKYDEQFISRFITENSLPCNSTTAFLTPTLRNHNKPLFPDADLVGRPRGLYKSALIILNDVAQGGTSAEAVLTEIVRVLMIIRDERRSRMESLLQTLKQPGDSLPLSTERILKLLEMHLSCGHSSRLPVLMVAAAYNAASSKLGEKALPLKGHTAADEQTGALGDIEITLTNDDRVVTVYEMKSKRMTIDDIDRALRKLIEQETRVDNYIFITTDVIEKEIVDYASDVYARIGGTEIAALDCIGFVRHFLHLFHRLRISFLNEYQSLMLFEPDSAVSQPLKEAFLSMRHAAEADE